MEAGEAGDSVRDGLDSVMRNLSMVMDAFIILIVGLISQTYMLSKH